MKTTTKLGVTYVKDIMLDQGLILGEWLQKTRSGIWVINHDQFERILWANLPTGDNKSFRSRIDAMVEIPDIYIGITNDWEIFLYTGDITSLLPVIIERGWVLLTDVDIGMFKDSRDLFINHHINAIYTDGMIKVAARAFALLTIGLDVNENEVIRWFTIDEKTRNILGSRHPYTYCNESIAPTILPKDLGIDAIKSVRLLAGGTNALQITATSGDIYNGTVSKKGSIIQVIYGVDTMGTTTDTTETVDTPDILS